MKLGVIKNYPLNSIINLLNIMIKFPSIEQFRHVVKTVRSRAEYCGKDETGNPIYKPIDNYPILKFQGTIKLHGTNGGIVFNQKTKEISFQSRERILTITEDNAGFYANFQGDAKFRVLHWLFDEIAKEINDFDSDIAIFGEWCGEGIQKGTGVNQLSKRFVIFAIQVGDIWLTTYQLNTIFKSPETLLLCRQENIFYIGNFPTFTIDIDFNKPEYYQNQLVKYTQQVEQQCPFANFFGIKGLGEGIVWTCIIENSEQDKYNSSIFWFKTKGEKHTTSKVTKLASVDIEAITKIDEFVEKVLTESRLEQGISILVNEKLKPLEMASFPEFIRWIHTDIFKEEKDVIDISQLNEKRLKTTISNKSRSWFIKRINT
jgi:hypothetical protein